MDPEDDRERERNETERPRIRVNDRRLFDREGNLRSDAESPEETSPAPSAEPSSDPGRRAPAAAAASSGVSNGVTARSGAPDTAGPSEASSPPTGAGRSTSTSQREPRRPSELPRDFPAFVESLYYEALLFLGAIPHPQTGEPIEDVEMAKYKIDLLSMLQEKTEGNRSPEESKLLDDILYQLRMLYLQKTKVVKL